MPTVAEVVEQIHRWYPPHTAESWDAVGLVSGDPQAPVRRIGFAVDPTIEVAREAAEYGAELLVVHHPLFLKPVHSVARTTPKARTLGVLTDAGCALLSAHTNADRAVAGVSESMGLTLGLTQMQPLDPDPVEPMDKLTVCVPTADADRVREALAQAGAGRIGDYDTASFSSAGQGRFRPLPGAQPAIGSIGQVEVVDEVRIECVLARGLRAQVTAALIASHPYQQPAWDLVELAPAQAGTGIGRIGTVTTTTLAEFASTVAQALPATATGVRFAGDPDRPITRVALCAGAGDSLLDLARRSDADVYVTSDLRHHPSAELMEWGGPALIDVAHWAAEWTWLPVVAARVAEAFGDTVETRVSRIVTDPWTARVG